MNRSLSQLAQPVSLTPAPSGVLQRKCACGGSAESGGECAECQKERLLQRSGPTAPGAGNAPAAVHRALATAGSPLDAGTRTFMESRFGHSFSQVRVHHDSLADESARSVRADAYTVGKRVVFAAGKYSPGTPAGRRLLAHELAHVSQQKSASPTAGSRIEVGAAGTKEEDEADAAAQAVASSSAAPPASGSRVALQRQAADEEEKQEPEAPPQPVPAAAAGTPVTPPEFDPAMGPQLSLATRTLLDPGFVRNSFLRLDLDSILGAPPPPWVTAPQLASPRQLVPAGPGPGTARPASMGDLVRGIMQVPAVESALTSLQTQALATARQDWRSLSTGGKAALVSQSALIAGGALAGVLSSPDARQFTLDLLQNRSLPTGVPGLDFQLNLTGPSPQIKFDLNVGQFLPNQWGFR
jgi:hypothetical protein